MIKEGSWNIRRENPTTEKVKIWADTIYRALGKRFVKHACYFRPFQQLPSSYAWMVSTWK